MRFTLLLLTLGWGAGCASKPAAPLATDSTTQRTRDSVLGSSRLPGATGVKGALRLSDSADARNARNAAISNDP